MTSLLERFRRPEYTGDNRCWPCTVTNSALLAILTVVLAVAGRRRTAAAVAAAGSLSIALRGYFVPYTPRFAPRIVASLPVEAFERADHDAHGSLSDSPVAADGTAETEADAPTGEDIVTALLEAGVVVPEGEEIRLDPTFREEWREEMRALRDADVEKLATVADRLTGPSVEARASSSWGRPFLVLDGGGSRLTTLRRGVAVAELAAARALESSVEDDAVRLAAGRPLRTLLERCPLCDAELTVTRSSCCGEVTPIGSTPSEKLICPECNVRFFTFDGETSERR